LNCVFYFFLSFQWPHILNIVHTSFLIQSASSRQWLKASHCCLLLLSSHLTTFTTILTLHTPSNWYVFFWILTLTFYPSLIYLIHFLLLLSIFCILSFVYSQCFISHFTFFFSSFFNIFLQYLHFYHFWNSMFFALTK